MLSFDGRPTSDLTNGYSVDVDIRTGAAALRVPVPAPPGLAGLAPNLTLEYSSGAGNSAFGAGWGLTHARSLALSLWNIAERNLCKSDTYLPITARNIP